MEHGTDKLKCNKMHVILLCNGHAVLINAFKKQMAVHKFGNVDSHPSGSDPNFHLLYETRGHESNECLFIRNIGLNICQPLKQ